MAGTDGDDKDSKDSLGRRSFLKSLFGLTAVSEPPASGATKSNSNVSFFWASLKSGHIAFPTGMSVPSGEPGSLMKLVSAAALREAGLYTGDETIECRGTVNIKNQVYNCQFAHGKVGLIKAIGLSCNVFFAEATQQLSPQAIVDYAERFGLNTPIAGYPSACFPAHPTGDPALLALGLSDQLKPNALQLMRMVALIGLSGKIPVLFNAAEEDNNQTPFSLELKQSTWHALQQGMRIAEREGTAKHLDESDKLHIAAKTGTVPHGKTFQSWIAGYFPHDNPSYAFCLRAPAGTSQDRAVPEARHFLLGSQWP